MFYCDWANGPGAALESHSCIHTRYWVRDYRRQASDHKGPVGLGAVLQRTMVCATPSEANSNSGGVEVIKCSGLDTETHERSRRHVTTFCAKSPMRHNAQRHRPACAISLKHNRGHDPLTSYPCIFKLHGLERSVLSYELIIAR